LATTIRVLQELEELPCVPGGDYFAQGVLCTSVGEYEAKHGGESEYPTLLGWALPSPVDDGDDDATEQGLSPA
jgi:hypothetical protein